MDEADTGVQTTAFAGDLAGAAPAAAAARADLGPGSLTGELLDRRSKRSPADLPLLLLLPPADLPLLLLPRLALLDRFVVGRSQDTALVCLLK